MKNILPIVLLIFCVTNTFAYTTRLSELKKMQVEDDAEEQRNKGNENNPRQPVRLDELDCNEVGDILEKDLAKVISPDIKFAQTKQKCCFKFGERKKKSREQSWSANLILIPDIYRGIRNVSLIISVHDKYGAKTANKLVDFVGAELCGVMDSVINENIQKDLDAQLKQQEDAGVDILECPHLEFESKQKAKGYMITKKRQISDGMLRKLELIIGR